MLYSFCPRRVVFYVLIFLPAAAILLTVHVPLFMKQQAAQVYFPADLYLQIKQVAAEAGLPMAAWIREIVTEEVQKGQKRRKKLSELPSFTWGKETDVSERIDEILYGHP